MSYEIATGSADFKFGFSKPEQLSQWLSDNPEAIGFSFVGRSNVGKSSTINSLFGRSTARTSKTPGRTREINIFTFKLKKDGKPDDSLPPIYLFDLPGYGHAKVSREIQKNWSELMGTFFEQSPSSTTMINIQDARHPNQTADIEFHQYLKRYRFDVILAFNKIDKLKKQKERAALNKLKPALYKEYKWVKQIFFISAETKDNLKQLEDCIITYIFNRIK